MLRQLAIALLVLAPLVSTGAGDQFTEELPGAMTYECPESGPRSLEEAVRFLDQQLSEVQKEKIRGYSRSEYTGALHMGTGMWLRNNVGLWHDCPLAKYFNARGVAHADNMSGAILDAYWRHLRGDDYDVASIISCYADWEKEAGRLRDDAEVNSEVNIPFPEFMCPDRDHPPWLQNKANPG